MKLEGKVFGKLTVLSYMGNKKYLCECSCGNKKVVYGYNLTNGSTKSCGCASIDDLTGKTFGRLTVLRLDGIRNNATYYECVCQCGKHIIVRRNSLTSGRTKSCGCLSIETTRKNNKSKINDLSGMVFGRLTALRIVAYNPVSYMCRCNCGKEVVVLGSDLTSGRTKSCGCLLKEQVASIADCGTNVPSIIASKLSSRNKTGIKGCYIDRFGFYIGEITFQGTKYRIGRWNDRETAKKEMKLAYDKIHGPFLEWYAESHKDKWEKINEKYKSIKKTSNTK